MTKTTTKTATAATTATSKDARKVRSGLRRYTPTAQLPIGSVLRSLSARDVQRLRRRLSEPQEVIHSDEFRKRSAERLMAPDVARASESQPEGLANVLQRSPMDAQRLSGREETEMFRRYNYCRYRVIQVLRKHANKRLTAAGARELIRWDAAAMDARDRIVQANLGLVPSMVERSRLTGVDFAELISEGQMALLRSVDKFDYARGFKFSTYACRAILTSVSRAVALMARYRTRFPTEYDPELQKSDVIEARRDDLHDTCVRELSRILTQNRADLTTTEQRVLAERFGVQSVRRRSASSPKTLRQVAEVFGVTKERVRQIQNKALDKIRDVLDEEVFAA